MSRSQFWSVRRLLRLMLQSRSSSAASGACTLMLEKRWTRFFGDRFVRVRCIDDADFGAIGSEMMSMQISY